ncbi:MAG: hypothetical protein ACFE0Q_01965 [Anaerolineae bacterium]
MPITQRLQQGIGALFAFARTVNYDLAEQYLTPEQMDLFRQMAKAEQLHSLNVLRDVLVQEQRTPHELAVAALLHDVGKARKHLAVWQKTLSILVRKFLPALDERLSREGDLHSWRMPFMVRRYHPQWGGHMLSQTDSSPISIWLVTHHAEPAEQWRDHPHYPLLVRLKAADDAN